MILVDSSVWIDFFNGEDFALRSGSGGDLGVMRSQMDKHAQFSLFSSISLQRLTELGFGGKGKAAPPPPLPKHKPKYPSYQGFRFRYTPGYYC
ncbi:MAG: hypothetical protein WD431_04215 [Cyclobacteriaceae bacterium]